MTDALVDKVAIVTGAAGSIGAATSARLLAAGASVLMSDLDDSELRTVAAALERDFPGRVGAIAGDAAEPETAARIVRRTIGLFGRLDIAFANAGVFGVIAPIVDYPPETFAEVLRVNVLGPFLLCRQALREMRDGGCVILTSSVVGLTSDPGIAAYATSKHALVGLMRTAMKEAAPRGIRVNTIHPGPTDNAFQHGIEMSATGLAQAAAAAAFEQMIPLGRHASADEVAALVEFLAGPGGAFISGATIAIDGGMSV